jgi:hypothetical protein
MNETPQIPTPETAQPVLNGRQPDGSVWLNGACLTPAFDSEAGRELARYHATHEFTGD